MKKTLYVRDEDEPIWERARELFGDTLAPTIAQALKRVVHEKEAEMGKAKGFERIEIEFDDSDCGNLPTKKAFTGRWIIPPEAGYVTNTFADEPEEGFVVAITAKNRIVVHGWRYQFDQMEQNFFRTGFWLGIYENFQEAAKDKRATLGANEAYRRSGVPVEELDI